VVAQPESPAGAALGDTARRVVEALAGVPAAPAAPAAS
jgi:hypothetical protein